MTETQPGTKSTAENNQSEAQAPVQKVDVSAVNTTSAKSLYQKRKAIHPRRSEGFYRNLKWWIMRITLGIYYITPWLRWDRGPGAPDQGVLIDFVNQRFYFFFIEIWPQEVYYIAGLLILSAVGLFLSTSLVGRAWCGYTCPQTVWTDMFLVVERFIEGDRAARIRLDKAPMSFDKLRKRVIKNILWLIISVGTGGAWIFYFADAPTLAYDFLTFNASDIAYITVAILTFTTFTLAGYMREQVCIYMCPWPRIQSAMMDEESLTVTYQEHRGEPRGAYRKGTSWDERGDCVACNHCVVVCPTGIDIRNGQQLECITCALCIDACDSIMSKVGRPKGLIRYDSVANQQRRAEGKPEIFKWFRIRTVAYALSAMFICAFMLTVLLSRADLDVNVLHDRNPLYTTLSDGSIRNGYTIKILNKLRTTRTLSLTLKGVHASDVEIVGGKKDEDYGPVKFTVRPDQQQSFRLLISVPNNLIQSDSTSILFELVDDQSKTVANYRSIFRGPTK